MKENIKCVDLLLTSAVAAVIALAIHHEIRKKQARKFIRHLQSRPDAGAKKPETNSVGQSGSRPQNEAERGNAD